jgi:hypothetical protein
MPLERTMTPASPTVQPVPPEPHSIPIHVTETPNGTNDPLAETEILQASIKAGSVAQIVVAVIAVVGLVYLLKLVMVTTLFSILLAFVLEPLVGRLARIGIPRAVGALLAVAIMVALAGSLTYFFYSRAVDFATQLPKYSGKVHSALADLRAQTSKIEESTRSVIASPNAGKPPLAVEVREAPGLSERSCSRLASCPSWCTSCLRGRIMRTRLPFSCFPRSIVWWLTARWAESRR